MKLCRCGQPIHNPHALVKACEDCRYQQTLVRKRRAEARRKGIVDIEAFLIEQAAKYEARLDTREALKQKYAAHFSDQEAS